MSKKYLIATANFTDWRQEFFEEYVSKRNIEYANLHNLDYLEFKNYKYKYRDHPSWLKFKIVSDLLEEKVLNDGDSLIFVDADICIAKTDKLFPINKSFTYAIDSGNTHCMGAISLKINDWSRQLIKDILDEKRYVALLNHQSKHDYLGFTNSFVKDFREQASWYYLAGIKRHSQKSFWEYPDFGWHSWKTEFTKYSLEELYANVEVLGTEWNVSEVRGESPCLFLINKVAYKDIIFRHFAGGQKWKSLWFDQKISLLRIKNFDLYLYIKSFMPKLSPYLKQTIKLNIKKFLKIIVNITRCY